MSSTILADRDVNTSGAGANAAQQEAKADVKSMEYHRQVLQSKLDEGKYVGFLFKPDSLNLGDHSLTVCEIAANKHTSRHPIPSCRRALPS
jgi:hypothetical protein